MATLQHTQSAPKPKIEGVGYDSLVTLAGIWLLIGLFVDGWAHTNQPQLETFFTPWHAILYSGATALGALIVGAVWLNQQRGYVKLSDAIPRGYRMSLIGVPVFFLGATGDLLWHTIFGIEVNIEALLSPTHLLLALGGILMGGGPMRAAWFRYSDPDVPMGWGRALPVMLSVGLLTAVFGFFLMYINPFAQMTAPNGYAPARFPFFDGEAGERFGRAITSLGLGSVLIYTAILSSSVLSAAKRWRNLPFGSMSIVIAPPIILMVAIRSLPGSPLLFVAIAVLGGLIADVLYARYRASGGNPFYFRVLAAGAPMGLFALYFLAILFFLDGIWWSVHLWMGAVATSGVVGWGMSYLIWPPPVDTTP